MTKKAVVKIVCTLVSILFLFALMTVSNNSFSQTNIQILNEVYYNGYTQEEVKLPTTLKVENKICEIVFNVNNIEKYDSLFFNSNATRVTVYIDESVIYDFEKDHNDFKLHNVVLEVTSAKVVVVYEFDSNMAFLNEIHVGSNINFTKNLFIKDFIFILLSVIMFSISLVLGIVVVYYYVLKKRNSLLAGYTIFSLLVSVTCLSQIDVLRYLFLDSFSISNIKYITIYLLPLPVTLVFYNFNSTAKMKYIYNISTISTLVLFSITTILVLANSPAVNVFYTLGFILCIVYLSSMLVMFWKYNNDEKTKTNTILLLALLIVIVAFVVEFFNEIIISFPGPSGMYSSGCIFILYGFAVSNVVRDYVKKENYRNYLSEENARLSSSILLSQIKPHFLYNALNSISYLCKKDPKQADIAVIRFSRYLRQNMKCIESEELMDFSSEMEHIKNYIYLECIRFPNMEVIYDLRYIDFKVPPLCIQPIVENAVKHGVSKNVNAVGHVVIKSFLTPKFIMIEISDNGIGFDSKLNIKGTGLSNISRRLKMLIDAEIEFGSRIGKGTVVRVKIPRKDVK